MSVDRNMFKTQLRVQLCKTCVEYKRERNFYMQQCKYYENLVAEMRNKNADKETSLVETEEVAQLELILHHGNENRDANTQPSQDDTHVSISNWNQWELVVPKMEPPDSPSPEQMSCDESEPMEENVAESETGILTAATNEPGVLEVQHQGPRENQVQDPNKTKVCRWMLEDYIGLLHMCGNTFASEWELTTHAEEHVTGDNRNGYACCWHDCQYGRTFKLKNTLVTHLATHTCENTYRCKYPGCVKEFACSKELKQHKDEHITRIVCKDPNCLDTFVTERVMLTHYRTQHTYKRVTPVPANRSKPCTSDFVQFHDELQGNNEPNKCGFPGCNRVFVHPEVREAHRSAHRTMLARKKDYTCWYEGCARSFANYKVFYEHVLTHATQGNMLTLLCGNQHGNGEDNTDAGTEVVVGNSESNANCSPPPNRDAEPEILLQAPGPVPTAEEKGDPGNNGPIGTYFQTGRLRSAPQRTPCYQVCQWETENEICGETLIVEDLMAHISEKHVGTEDSTRHVCTWHLCDRKDRVFFFKNELMSHVQVHVFGHLFRCSTKTCRQWYTTEQELAEHRKVHEAFNTARPQIPCPHKNCRRRFWNTEYLRKHVANKHTPKEYRCPDESCGLAFKSKERMTEHHSRVHEGVIMFKCKVEECGREFNCSHHLRRHVRLLHLMEKPFRCTVQGCNKEFAYPTTYETHRKTHLTSSTQCDE